MIPDDESSPQQAPHKYLPFALIVSKQKFSAQKFRTSKNKSPPIRSEGCGSVAFLNYIILFGQEQDEFAAAILRVGRFVVAGIDRFIFAVAAGINTIGTDAQTEQ